MEIELYNHLIEINETDRTLTIYRLRGSEKELYTRTDIPDVIWDQEQDEMKTFCRRLGENILLDSPQARKLLQI
ncbi:MAG TPA: hypothetical protein VHY57_08570 [Rhizomicrobium sp.]|nr:hypothetical protein [Rhizomicrobium sp.]